MYVEVYVFSLGSFLYIHGDSTYTERRTLHTYTEREEPYIQTLSTYTEREESYIQTLSTYTETLHTQSVKEVYIHREKKFSLCVKSSFLCVYSTYTEKRTLHTQDSVYPEIQFSVNLCI